MLGVVILGFLFALILCKKGEHEQEDGPYVL